MFCASSKAFSALPDATSASRESAAANFAAASALIDCFASPSFFTRSSTFPAVTPSAFAARCNSSDPISKVVFAILSNSFCISGLSGNFASNSLINSSVVFNAISANISAFANSLSNSCLIPNFSSSFRNANRVSSRFFPCSKAA